jgi:ATP synthase, Delta/Epsilon chain, beta-sandwich domain
MQLSPHCLLPTRSVNDPSTLALSFQRSFHIQQEIMLSRTLLSRASTRLVAKSCLSTEASAAAVATVNLNFCLPHLALYENASVHSVILPGLSGEYGITANHVPYVAQLKAGVVQILHDETSPPEKYFVAGGYSLTHENSTTVRSTKAITPSLEVKCVNSR